nr:ATP-binding cassette domain-containing protein [Maliibacterium massiliense]
MDLLTLQNVSMQVEDQKEILKNIDLSIAPGKLVAVTGPNGGGKSTLAKVVAGILQPTAGRILYEGKDITQASITQRAQMGIGFAFQQPVRFKGITVRDIVNLAAGATLTDMQLCDYLSDVGLCARDYIDREINASLSGGEIKRIEIAGVMARKSRLTIFDEPEAGIDLWSFNNLIGVFKNLRRTLQGSVIIISHQERILDIADEIVVLSGGQITARGAREQILPELLASEGQCLFCPGKEVQ